MDRIKNLFFTVLFSINVLYSAQSNLSLPREDDVSHFKREAISEPIIETWALKGLLTQTPEHDLYRSPLLGIIAVENGTITTWYGKFTDEFLDSDPDRLKRKFDSATTLEKITRLFFDFRDGRVQCIALPSSPVIALESKIIARWISMISEMGIQRFVDVLNEKELLGVEKLELKKTLVDEWYKSYTSRPEARRSKGDSVVKNWFKTIGTLLTELIKDQTAEKAQQQFLTVLLAYMYLKDLKEGAFNNEYSLTNYFKQMGVVEYAPQFYSEQEKAAIACRFKDGKLGDAITSLEDAVFYMTAIAKGEFGFLNQPFVGANLIGYPSGTNVEVGLCAEATLRSIGNCILYDFSKKIFDFSYLSDEVKASLNKDFVDFYTTHNDPFVKDYYGATIYKWVDFLKNLGNFPRVATNCGLSGDIKNLLTVLNAMFGMSETSLEGMGRKLSTPDHTVDFVLIKKNRVEETYQLEVFDKKTQTRIKGLISSTAAHVVFSFSSGMPLFFLQDAVVNQILVLQNKYGVVLAPIVFTKEIAGIVDGGEILFHKSNILALNEFLKAGTFPDLSSHNGTTWLYRAVENDDKEKIALLLQYGAKNIAQKDQKTPLALAGQRGFIAAVKMMHDAGFVDSSVDVGALLSKGEAINNENYQIIHNLLASSSPTVIAKDRSGNTALHYALLKGDQQAVTMLLAQPCASALVQEKDSQGRTPLLLFLDTSYGDWDLESLKGIVQVFIEKGADLTVQDSNGNGVLHYALKWNDVDLIETLLKAGAATMVNIPNNNKETPLEEACYPLLEDILLAYGADPRMKISHADRSLLDSSRKDPGTFERFNRAAQALEEKGIPNPMGGK